VGPAPHSRFSSRYRILTDRTLKSDEIHPNAKGYDLMAERMADPMQKLLKRAGGARWAARARLSSFVDEHGSGCF
jgi:hypothetical protein